MSTQRPLAVVMVADPTPLTVTNLLRLSEWCDLVLTEATSTISGEPRRPLRADWRQLLGLKSPSLRVITTDLAGQDLWRREAIQRDSAIPVITFEAADRPVLMVDADEFLDMEAVLGLIDDGIASPSRLGLVPLYAGVDRVARSIHCCWRAEFEGLRDPVLGQRRPYVVAAPSLALAGQMLATSPSQVRFRSPLRGSSHTFGIHVTMCGSAEQTAWKLRNMRERWDPRIFNETHLQTMLSNGVHHAGWWIADYRKPEDWLVELAGSCDLRLCGPLQPMEHLMALRGWAQARLDPRIPEELVHAGDAYASKRTPGTDDFLPDLDAYLRERPVDHTGRDSRHPGSSICH